MSMADEVDRIKRSMESEFDQAVRRQHPKGWEPRCTEGQFEAEGVSVPYSTSVRPDEEDLIRGWGLDPEVWEIIDGTLTVNRWQAMKSAQFENEQVWMYQYKARLHRRIPPEDRADVEALYRRIRGKRPKEERPTGENTFLILIGDTQVGKAPEGNGSAGTVDRWLSSLDRTILQLKALRRTGQSLGKVALAFMGDLGESCSGNYPSQAFTTDLTMREQDSILQELIYETLEKVAPLADTLDVITVPGNHGENRLDGKAFTLPTDNRDVSVVETVHRGIRRNENHAFDHVRFIYPTSQELTVCVDLSGVHAGFAHGHQFGGGATPAQKATNWWKDQAHGMTVVGDAEMLFSGHYHHLVVNQSGRKTHIQVPSLDGGSQWWENKTAQVSPPGMVSLVVGEGIGPAGCGWDSLRVS